MIANIKGKLVNQPPKATLAPESTAECDVPGVPGHAAFALDGSAADPDNNVASFAWFRGSRTGQLIGTRSTVEVEQPLTPANEPPTTYVFKVIDEFGQYAEAITKITVLDTTPPTVTAPPDKTAECKGVGTLVEIGTATASDMCDAAPVVGHNAPGGFLFPLGTTKVTWTATTSTARDPLKNVATAEQQVTIVDTKPPSLTVTLSPSVLWSPDHKLVPITAKITVTDECDPNPTVELISIVSNEADNGLGDGDTARDIQGHTLNTDDRSFLLRSERSGNGSGRVYTVTYQATDASGHKSPLTSATVTVPKNQK
jgi:hypothetical protein